MGFCESHLDLVKSVAIIETTITGLDKRINGSLLSIEKHMDQGMQWRMAIIGTVGMLFIQFIFVVVFASRMGKQIEFNTKRLDTLEVIAAKALAMDSKSEPLAEATTLQDERLDRVQLSLEKLGDRLNSLEHVLYDKKVANERVK